MEPLLLLPDEDDWVTTTDDKNESNELWVSEILDLDSSIEFCNWLFFFFKYELNCLQVL